MKKMGSSYHSPSSPACSHGNSSYTYHLQCHQHRQSPLLNGASLHVHHQQQQYSRLCEGDISSPTSWEFRCDGRPKHVGVSPPPYHHPPQQIMLRSPHHYPQQQHPPPHLHLNLSQTGCRGGSTSSAASSLSTTPSPLEEQPTGGGPTHQLSYYQAIHFGSGQHTCSVSAAAVASVSGCACGDENVTLLLGGDGAGQDPLDLSEGSRTSTGSSQRSQDSGFSDAGETRKERKSQTLVQQGSPPQYPPPPPPPLRQEEEQIYECVGPPPVMPSPIPATGFGCGRFPVRPASVDISMLDAQHHFSHHPSLPPPPCIDCLSCSTIVNSPQPPPADSSPLITLPLPPRQRRSFSPSALASSSTHTALAALRVPLSSSTPKRATSSQSTSRLCNGQPALNRIDNFESLNKNAGMNKDNNNNSGTTNKTYTLAPSASTSLGHSNLSSGSNGTVFAHSSHRNCSNEQERAPATFKKRSAAESIYDKICNRLSSLSSSTSSNSTSSTPNTTSKSSASAQHSSHPHSNLAPSSLSSSKFRVFARGPSAKWQSLPRGVGLGRPPLEKFPSLRENTSAPPTYLEEEGPYHEERPIDVPAASSNNEPSHIASSTAAWRSCVTPTLPETDSPVVRLWLKDLRTQTEPECLHSLQNKWILPCLEEDEDDDEHEVDDDESARPPTTTSPSSSSIFMSSSRKVSSGSGASSSSMPSSSTSSYVRGLRRQQERRSQQRFLSSMTAAIHAVSTPLMSIRTVEMTANVISAEFSKICKHLEFGVFTQVPTLVMSLVGHIQDFLRGIQTPSPTPAEGSASCFLGPTVFGLGHLKKLEGRLEDACFALSMAVRGIMGGGGLQGAGTNDSSGASSSSALLEGEQYQQVIADVVEGIVTVGNLFSEVVDLRLTRDLGSILDTIEGGGIPARIALKSLVTVLADGGNHICRLAADIRTVRGLLGVMLDTREDQDKILALRCLATVLCVGEAVKDFDKAGGFEIIADILHEPSFPLPLKLEAVAVLTQATDPWIDLESTLMTLGVHLEKFIVSLTNLLVGELKTEEEPFLLIAAAISNLTFLEVASTQYLKRCRTVSFLISAVRSHPFSVFVLDHVATILANMAGVESCRQEIIQSGGIDCLLHFLEQKPATTSSSSPKGHDPTSISAITACERLQQKSTIALSRLANEDGVARYVFQRRGFHRLINLCRKEQERNYSDGVLIAALATLRKLVSQIGSEALKSLEGAEDLLQPRLLDSFLLYSSRQESYV